MKRTKMANKKGFTMVELVIVIAVLAILAAIAIPIINTVIKSSKLSAMESDCATLETVLSTALMEYESDNKYATYNNAPANGSTKVSDILHENDIDNVDFVRTIGGVNYYMTWKNRTLTITNSPAHSLTNSMTLYDLKTA